MAPSFSQISQQLQESGLFDSNFYRSAHRDIANSNQEPLEHFLLYGAREKRSPHILFDGHYYVDAASTPNDVGDNPLLHFLNSGYRMGFNPHPLFDMDYYCAQIGKLANNENLLLHFLNGGFRNRCNPHPLFDTDYYCRQAGNLLDNENPLLHFLSYGAQLRLNPHPLFDVAFYLESNPDVKKWRMNPLVHYMKHGAKEGRSPHMLFDRSYYFDLAPAPEEIGENPLLHFISEGCRKGFNPHPLFDIEYYCRQAGVDPDYENPLVHYLLHGAELGLSPHPLFDAKFYQEHNQNLRKQKLNPLVHFLRYGKSKYLSPHPFFDTRFYLSKYPDLKALAMNPLVHFAWRGAREYRWPNADFDPFYYSKVIAPVVVDNPLLHYLETGRIRGLSTCPEEPRIWYFPEGLATVLRTVIFAFFCFLQALTRSSIDRRVNYDHQFSAFKFWQVAMRRFWQGHGAKVKLTIPSYLTQPRRLEKPRSHAYNIRRQPLSYIYLYLANVFKAQGFMADAENILHKLAKQPEMRSLALSSLGDMFLIQAAWAQEFRSYEKEGIALNPFSSSAIFSFSQTWHYRKFDEVLEILEEAIRANSQNTDAQWLLCYGYLIASDYAKAISALDRYPGRSSESSERNLFKARAKFHQDPDGAVSLQRQHLGDWSNICNISHLEVISIVDMPLWKVQDHILVISNAKLPITSRVVRNREEMRFERVIEFAPSYVSRFKKAEVTPEYGMVIVEDQLLIKESSHVKPCHIPLFNPYIQEISEKNAFYCAPRAKLFKDGNCVYIGHNNNFYHWLLEELPRLGLLDRSDMFCDAPILIDQRALQWQYELLSMLAVDKDRLCQVDFRRPVCFKNLIVPSRLSRDLIAHPEAVAYIRKNLLPAQNLKPDKNKRIYITRDATTRRTMLNERSIVDRFKRANFQIVNPSRLSIKEQIELFCDAGVIAGAGGAGLANIVFAPQGAKVLSLGASDILCETFTSIAAAIGQESWSCRGRSYPRPHPYWIWTNFDFEIEEADLDFCFNRIL